MNGGAKHEAVASRNFFKEQVHAVIPEALARFPAFAAGDAPGYRMTAYPENFRFHAAALQRPRNFLQRRIGTPVFMRASIDERHFQLFSGGGGNGFRGGRKAQPQPGSGGGHAHLFQARSPRDAA